MALLFIVADIMKELADTSKFIELRGSSGTVDTGRLEVSMIAAITNKIAIVKPFSAIDAFNVTEKVNETSLSEAAKQTLHTSVDNRLSGTVAGHQSETTATGITGQLLTASNRYLTASDWEWIDDPRSDIHRMMIRVASRYGRLGLRSCHEQTKRWAIAALIHVVFRQRSRWPSYSELKGWVDDFMVYMLRQKKQARC